MNDVWDVVAENSLVTSLIKVTEGELETQLVPLDVKTFPFVLGATVETALVPLPTITPLAVKVVAPVPPFVTEIVVAFQVPVPMVPTVVIAADPIEGAAPIVLYEIVLAADPLNVEPVASPFPLLLIVKLLTVFVEKLILALPSKDVPLIVTAVANLDAVAAFPLIDPIIGLLKVFVPVTVCAPASVMSPFELNVDQSVADNKPLLVIEAVGIFKVIVGVVVPFATVLLKSVPLVPKVKAATAVTVPLVSEGFPVKSA